VSIEAHQNARLNQEPMDYAITEETFASLTPTGLIQVTIYIEATYLFAKLAMPRMSRLHRNILQSRRLASRIIVNQD